MKKKELFVLALFVFLPTILRAEEVIRIGVLAPLDIPVGKGLKNGVEMAAEKINTSGGIMGKKVELVIADDKMKPVVGAYEYTRLATQEKVAAVLGTFASEVALAVVEQVPKYKVPFIGGSATPEITDKVKQNYDAFKYVFKVFHNGYEIADFSSEWLIKEMVKKRGLKRFALIVENANWARPVAAKWERELQDVGVFLPVIEYIDKNTKDFKPIFAKIAAAKCEMICILTAITDASPLITQWADSEGVLLGGVSGSFATAWKTTDGKALSMISLSFPGIFGLNAKDKAFSGKYREKYKTLPEYTSIYVYDALYLLKHAVERAKSVEADAIVDAMEKTDYTGVMGRWVFDKASHHSEFGPGFRQFLIMQWQPGEKVCAIWPSESKTCEMIFPPWK